MFTKKPKKLLAVVAHPDDETFEFGGTLAKYAEEGVEIQILCATRGESGMGKGDVAKVREQELFSASQILGVQTVEFLDYIDGQLCNNVYHEVAQKIEEKIKAFQPQVVLTFDHHGVSGHIDHVFMSFVTTFVCQHHAKPRLFYVTELKNYTRFTKNYFIYFPQGCEEKDTHVTIDISSVWKTKVEAMHAHKSQIHDVRRTLLLKRFFPKREYFIAAHPKKDPQSSSDLFDY